jgi:hypothetical protein
LGKYHPSNWVRFHAFACILLQAFELFCGPIEIPIRSHVKGSKILSVIYRWNRAAKLYLLQYSLCQDSHLINSYDQNYVGLCPQLTVCLVL